MNLIFRTDIRHNLLWDILGHPVRSCCIGVGAGTLGTIGTIGTIGTVDLLLEFKDCTQGVARFLSCNFIIRLLLQHQLAQARVGEQVKDVDEEEKSHDKDSSVEETAEYVHSEEVIRPVQPRRFHHLPH